MCFLPATIRSGLEGLILSIENFPHFSPIGRGGVVNFGVNLVSNYDISFCVSRFMRYSRHFYNLSQWEITERVSKT